MNNVWLVQRAFWFGHKILVVWWWFTRPVTQGVKCIVFHTESVLLIRLSYGHKRWVFPGGGVHKNETTQAAAVREIKEEVGITIQITDLQLLTTYQQQIEYKSDTVTCYVTYVDEGSYTIDQREVIEARWFPVTDLPLHRSENVDSLLALVSRKNSA